LKLCLYDDASRESDVFYKRYMEPARSLRNFLRSRGKNYDYFYRIYADYEKTKRSSSELMGHILNDISRDGAFLEIKKGLIEASLELRKLDSQRSRSLNLLKRQLVETIETQRN